MTSALEATYAYKVRLLRVRDLCFKVFLVLRPSYDLGSLKLRPYDDLGSL